MLTCPSMGRKWWLPPGGRTVSRIREGGGEVAESIGVAGRRYQVTLDRADMGKVLCGSKLIFKNTLHKTIKYTQNTKKPNKTIHESNSIKHNSTQLMFSYKNPAYG